jgi:teichuronic acid biosynthesis glycosyltransferase TuaG
MDADLNSPLISIIMPAYNAERFVAKAILSVQNQTYQDWELIVVDDGSTDNMADIVKSIQVADKRIKYIYQENKKQGAARNNGTNNATGNWIAFLDADDVWHPEKLERQFNCVKEIIADVFYTGGIIIDEYDQSITSYKTVYGSYSPIQVYKMLFESNPIPILSVIFKRQWIEKVGLQDEDIRVTGCEDWDYWIRLAKAGAIFYGLDEPLFYYRRHSSNMSSNYMNMRLAQAAIFIKNFDPSILGVEKGNKIFRSLMVPLLVDLVSAGRRNDADYVFNGVQQILPSCLSSLNYFLIRTLGRKWEFVLKIKRRFFNRFKKAAFKLRLKRKLYKNGFPILGNINIANDFSMGKYRNIQIASSNVFVEIQPNVSFREFCNILLYENGALKIGQNVFFNNYCSINCLGNIEIGANSIFGEGVKIYDHNHKYHKDDHILTVERNEFTIGQIKIGKNCWIGSNVTILNNVEIGDNVIIGANCLIYKSVASNSIIKAQTNTIN